MFYCPNPQCGASSSLSHKNCPSCGRSWSILPGTVIGEYQVKALLGEGGQAEVWEVFHSVLQRKAALKVLKVDANPPGDKTLDDRGSRRFENEAKAISRVKELSRESQSNFVELFSYGEFQGRPYYVMELLKGETLSSYIRRKGPIPFSDLLSMTKQLCHAIDTLHQVPIIHRDLKPENIFLLAHPSGQPVVKLLDLGIAKILQPRAITKTSTTMGTPAYMSPEQAMDAKYVGKEADFYSLGITLYEMICARTPFKEKDTPLHEILLKHQFSTPPPPSKAVSGRVIPSGVDAVVLRCLEKDPNKRPASAREVYKELASALGSQREEREVRGAKAIWGLEVPIPLPELVPDPVVAPTAQRAVKMKAPSPYFAMVLGLLLLVALLLYWWLR